MDQQSKANLEANGWQVGNPTDFLNLTTEDLLIIEIKLALSQRLEERQKTDTAKAIIHEPSTQSSLTQPTDSESLASIDKLIRDIIATGASPQEIGQLIASINTAA
ncbi:MAG: transcriptional regulator [Cyanobacteria bacterium P01_A01_bin.116]